MDPHLHLVPKPAGPAGEEPGLPQIRVVVADDHELMRHGLCLALEDEPDVEVVAETADVASTAYAMHDLRPDVLVLDLRLRGGSDIRSIRELHESAPATRIVALSMNASQLFARHALESGAFGFVLKERADEELVAAVRAAAAGQLYVSPRLAAPAGAVGE
jgi:two-component system response regulator NreC